MDDKMLAPEQLIEVWRCCSMEFPGKDCGDCPVSIACKRLQGGDDAEEFYKRLFCQAAYHLHCEMSRKQQWISVEDRLPEKEGTYLVLGVLDDEPSLTFDSYNDGNFDGNRDGTGRFTHWMPAPEPPEGRKA